MKTKKFLLEVPEQIAVIKPGCYSTGRETTSAKIPVTADLLKQALTHRSDYDDPEICFEEEAMKCVRVKEICKESFDPDGQEG